MPTFKYTCQNCKVTEQRLVSLSAKDKQYCKFCKGELLRAGTEGFSVSTPLDTSKKDAYSDKEIDRVIGSSSNEKWTDFHKRREERLRGANIVDIPIKPGETFNPETLLGDDKRKQVTKTFSDSVRENQDKVRQWDKKGFTKVSI